jgi:hypothetical protein
MQCQPLLENQFKPIIADNYYSQTHFRFELDHAQTSRLISLLASLAVAPGTSVTQSAAKRRTIFQALPPNDAGGKGKGFKALALEIEHSDHSSQKSDSTDVASSFDEDNQPLEAQLDANLVDQDEKNVILMKLKELALRCEHQDLPVLGFVDDTAVMNGIQLEEKTFPIPLCEHQDMPVLGFVDDTAVMNGIQLEDNTFQGKPTGVEEKKEESPHSSTECQSTIAQVIEDVSCPHSMTSKHGIPFRSGISYNHSHMFLCVYVVESRGARAKGFYCRTNSEDAYFGAEAGIPCYALSVEVFHFL